MAHDAQFQAAHDRMKATMASIDNSFFERQPMARAAMCAAIAEEHILWLGAPGTAKTDLVSAIGGAIMGRPAQDVMFEVLLTKFTTPDEVFGPVDFEQYSAGRYVRITDGKAWAMPIVLFDEIFKASSSILNCLLKMMQQRLADNGGSVPIPLEVVFGLSNEYPQDDDLNALYDRFLFKHWVDYIADPANMKALLLAAAARKGAPVIASMDASDLGVLRAAAFAVPFGPDEAERMLRVKAAVEKEGFRPSDRTWVKCIKVLRASAVVDGRDRIAPRDYRALADCLWRRHEDRPRLLACIGNAADPYGSKAEAIMDAIKLALRDIPDMSLLKSGKMRKTEMTNALALVSKRVCAELDKAREVHDQAQDDTTAEVVRAAEAALDLVDKQNREAMFSR